MSILTEVFLGTALLAGTFSLLVFMAWLWVQVEGNYRHVYRNRKRDDEDHCD